MSAGALSPAKTVGHSVGQPYGFPTDPVLFPAPDVTAFAQIHRDSLTVTSC